MVMGRVGYFCACAGNSASKKEAKVTMPSKIIRFAIIDPSSLRHRDIGHRAAPGRRNGPRLLAGGYNRQYIDLISPYLNQYWRLGVRPDLVERRLKLRELRILLTVAKAGSMAKAAAELAISQPNVSKAIADLEQAFGARLVDRSARGVEPTTYGLAVIRRGVAVFDELRHAVDDVAFLADPTSGELRLGCSDWTASVVGAAIDQISRRYPRIVFDVVSTDAIALQRELKGRTEYQAR
jgi:molybdenum-dependent DNA-binding transcriptional regulator ModE